MYFGHTCTISDREVQEEALDVCQVRAARSGPAVTIAIQHAMRCISACIGNCCILLYNACNRHIQQTLIVPRACTAIQLYSARVYCAYTAALYRIQPIHYTALYADPLGVHVFGFVP